MASSRGRCLHAASLRAAEAPSAAMRKLFTSRRPSASYDRPCTSPHQALDAGRAWPTGFSSSRMSRGSSTSSSAACARTGSRSTPLSTARRHRARRSATRRPRRARHDAAGAQRPRGAGDAVTTSKPTLPVIVLTARGEVEDRVSRPRRRRGRLPDEAVLAERARGAHPRPAAGRVAGAVDDARRPATSRST